MALGSVNMVSFVPKEIGALLGNTSVIPFTRAEIEALVIEKRIPRGSLLVLERRRSAIIKMAY